jgi:hypothetical protein
LAESVAKKAGVVGMVAGTAAGVAAEEGYKRSGSDKQFDAFIDNSITPAVQSGVEIGLDAIDSTVEFGSNVMNDIGATVSDWFGEDNSTVRP